MANMYNVTLIFNPDKLKAVISEFNKLGITGITVTHVEGCGAQHGFKGYYRGVETEIQLLPKVKVEVIVSAIPVDKVIETAAAVLDSKEIGAGKIFVYDVEKVYRVRTKETDFDALQDKRS
ncbi:MAG: P-II family nitrogen regulator [Treponema sp.]|jgi:nitrogen regulatory protein PII|nr:P-II family nitrogen regulator [Treponema sp.]